MKRWLVFLLMPLCLIGCKQNNPSMDELYAFREDLLQSEGIRFEAEITVDYGQEFYAFQVECTTDDKDKLQFEILKPDSISGIQGTISKEDGHLRFDDYVLAFKSVADDRLTPVSAPWVFLTALRGGYITSCGKNENGYTAIIRDTYEEDPLILEIYFSKNTPISAEIFWNQTRVITMQIQNFTM